MRMRSTGLGQTELEAEVTEFEPEKGLLVMHIHTTNPVIWHVRAGIQRRDIFRVMKVLLSYRVIKHVLGMILWGEQPEPEQF